MTYEVVIYHPASDGQVEYSITRYLETRLAALDAVDAAADAIGAAVSYGCPWAGYLRQGDIAVASFAIRLVTYLLVAQDSGATETTSSLEFFAQAKGLTVDGSNLVDDQGVVLYTTVRI